MRRSANVRPPSAASASSAVAPSSFVDSRCLNGMATRTACTGRALASSSPATGVDPADSGGADLLAKRGPLDGPESSAVSPA